eukprot:TRINITY_DN5501_c0_g1_i1.p1 TRINITY_DN5501_c0_g1~~TRINITY_DN5501_c0_g1_i1.p1  ORF type:complete len:485 (+),score=84.44 TRINITY_DN5501_c0_g1_i1:98-1552(+)
MVAVAQRRGLGDSIYCLNDCRQPPVETRTTQDSHEGGEGDTMPTEDPAGAMRSATHPNNGDAPAGQADAQAEVEVLRLPLQKFVQQKAPAADTAPPAKSSAESDTTAKDASSAAVVYLEEAPPGGAIGSSKLLSAQMEACQRARVGLQTEIDKKSDGGSSRDSSLQLELASAVASLPSRPSLPTNTPTEKSQVPDHDGDGMRIRSRQSRLSTATESADLQNTASVMRRSFTDADNNHHKFLNAALRELGRPWFGMRIRYYWIGLRDNKRHKYRFLKYKAELAVLKKTCSAIISKLYNDVAAEHEQAEREMERQSAHLSPAQASTGRSSRVSVGDSPSHRDVGILKSFNEIDHFLLTYCDLLWCAQTPVDAFLPDYFERRDEVFNRIFQRGNELDEEPVDGPGHQPSLADADILAAVISELDTMGSYINESIQLNEQLPFKVLLCAINSFIFLLQLFNFDISYVLPDDMNGWESGWSSQQKNISA